MHPNVCGATTCKKQVNSSPHPPSHLSLTSLCQAESIIKLTLICEKQVWSDLGLFANLASSAMMSRALHLPNTSNNNTLLWSLISPYCAMQLPAITGISTGFRSVHRQAKCNKITNKIKKKYDGTQRRRRKVCYHTERTGCAKCTPS